MAMNGFLMVVSGLEAYTAVYCYHVVISEVAKTT